jgi:8-oxo-dGTP diphosphatase
MKPTKYAVAIVIPNDQGEFLIVKRPMNEDGPLAGVWGFPAITRADGEDEEEAAKRVGSVKLGVTLEIGERLGTQTIDRGSYTLTLSDYTARIIGDQQPSVPQQDTSLTQYTELRYTNDQTTLFPAARLGSLCSRVFLQSRGIDWKETTA